MFDYKQRPATDEYRSGWDKIFGEEEPDEDEDDEDEDDEDEDENYNEDPEE